MIQRLTIGMLLLLFVSCSSIGNFFPGSENVEVQGTNYATAKMSVKEAYENFRIALEENEGISIIAELDHGQNAGAVEMQLPDSRIIFFGNPEMGTRLMQRNQLAGLDLPLRVLFYEKEEQVVALYNSASYFERRYGLGGTAILEKISGNLDELVGNAMNAEVVWGRSPDIDKLEGIKTVQSNRDFAETYAALKEVLEKNEDIKIIAEIDHGANAAGAGLALRPTKLIMFGNPNLGTPLMQSALSAGLDLPQKILVWEEINGTVNISYNTPQFLQDRHGIKDRSTELNTISTALNDLSKTAGGL